MTFSKSCEVKIRLSDCFPTAFTVVWNLYSFAA